MLLRSKVIKKYFIFKCFFLRTLKTNPKQSKQFSCNWTFIELRSRQHDFFIFIINCLFIWSHPGIWRTYKHCHGKCKTQYGFKMKKILFLYLFSERCFGGKWSVVHGLHIGKHYSDVTQKVNYHSVFKRRPKYSLVIFCVYFVIDTYFI